MRVFGTLLMGFICVLVVGCKTIPAYDVKNGFTSAPAKNKGRILISTFRIPKEETGVSIFKFLGALGGANTNTKYSASIYDVTNDIQYIGTISSSNYDTARSFFNQKWVEYNPPVGKRLLMLTSGFSVFPDENDSPHIDFVEVEARENKTNHVAITQYGYTQMPYFGIVKMSRGNYQFCSNLSKKIPAKTLMLNIKNYMKSNKIDEHAIDFQKYCLSLAKEAKVILAKKETRKLFLKSKPSLSTLKNDNYDQWLKSEDKLPPYNLMKSYKPDKEEEI